MNTSTGRTRAGLAAALTLMVTAIAALPVRAASTDEPLSAMLHDTWSTDDGLPQSAIEVLMQTSDGYLWMGTQLGLVRFNGADFHTDHRHNTTAMASSVVTDLEEADDGTVFVGLNGGGVLTRASSLAETMAPIPGLEEGKVIDMDVGPHGVLWVATLEGVYRYDPAAEGHAQAVDEASGQLLRHLHAGSDGSVWLAPRTGGLLRYHPGDFHADPPLLADAHALCIVESPDGSLLTGTDRGVHRIATDGTVTPYGRGLREDLVVTSLLQGKDDALWVGTQESGLWRVSVWGAEQLSRREGLSADHVTSLVEDPEGSIWVGTHGGGLNRLREAPITSHPTSLPWVVTEDRQGNLWLGAATGLHRLERGAGLRFPGEHVLEDLVVGAIMQADDDSLWIGSLGDGLRHIAGGEVVLSADSRSGLPGDRVFALTQDTTGAVWAGTDGGVVRIVGSELQHFGVDHGLSAATVRVLHHARSGVLWACTDGDGCFHLRGDRFVPVEGGEDLSTPQRLVTSLFEDPDGGIWLTTDGGLLRWRDGRFDGFAEPQGLPRDGFYRVLEDPDGFLWLSGNYGVFRVERAQLEAVAAGEASEVSGLLFGEAQGMRWTECNGGSHPAGWRDRDGILWFPTTGGLVAIDPTRLRPNELAPPVYIETFTAGDDSVPLEGEPSFRPGTGQLTFHYAALSFTGPEQVTYRVMLEGLDTDWVDKGSVREAYYHTLPPGRYVFRVIAANSDGVWNEEGASFAFTLRPSWHQRWEIHALGTLLVILLGIAIPVVRIRQLTRREAALREAVDERTAELRELSLRDPLTGLRNRRFLWEVLGPQAGRPAPGGETPRRRADEQGGFGVIMVDIDRFKQVNDSWGHATGDEVLKAVAAVLQRSARAEDIVVRWGGEEFLLVLQRAEPGALAQFAERLRAAVAALELQTPTGEPLRRSCSAGICHHPFPGRGGTDLDIEQVIALADAALYRAKQRGRDRAVQVLAGPNPPRGPADRQLMVTDIETAAGQGLIVIREPGTPQA